MNVGITGADGLLGYHVRARLHSMGASPARLANRATFENAERLDEFVRGLDAVIHFAGINRSSPDELEAGNIGIASELIAAFSRTGVTPTLVYANTTHAELDTPYGRGKRGAAALFRDWGTSSGANFVDLVIPNVFGEFGRPYYNSGISTFCHQLAVGEAPTIIEDREIELIHAQTVAQACLDAASAGASGQQRLRGDKMLVSTALQRLKDLHSTYLSGIMPNLTESIDLQLFNTLRSYLFPDIYPVELKLNVDPRGSLFEAVKTIHGGQAFLSTTVPGITRGNHFHLRKVERFLVVGGEAEIQLRKLFDTKIHTYAVSGRRPCYIDMPTFHTHSIRNTGDGELTTLFWTNEIFDSADPDTFAEKVVG